MGFLQTKKEKADKKTPLFLPIAVQQYKMQR